MIWPPTHDMPVVCPFCGTRHNAVTAAGDDADRYYPEDGDVSMCFECGRFLLYDNTLAGGLRKPTPQEQREFDASERCQLMIKAWKIVKQ